MTKRTRNLRGRLTYGGPVSAYVESIQILDSTPLDVIGTVGINPNGWVAKVVIRNTAILPVFKAEQLSFTVTDPGYTNTGSVTSVQRTIRGVAILRRQFTNTGKLYDLQNKTLTVYVSLSDNIYTATSIGNVTIASDFFPKCKGSPPITKTNSSTKAYPKPVFGWITCQNQIVRDQTYTVEAVAFHPYARNGRQVACMQFYSKSSTNVVSADVTVSSTQLSQVITRNNIPEVYRATVSISQCTEPGTGTKPAINKMHARVYPFIGDSNAVLDTSTISFWPTHSPFTPLQFAKDTTNALLPYYAYVKIGVTGGAANSDPAMARTTPFPTIYAATQALFSTYCPSRSSGKTCLDGCVIRLMDNDGADAVHTNAGDNTTNAYYQYTTGLAILEKDPLATANVTLMSANKSTAYSYSLWPNILVRNLSLRVGASNFAILGGVRSSSLFGIFVVDNCTVSSDVNVPYNTAVGSSSKMLFDGIGLRYIYNTSFVGSNNLVLGFFGEGNSTWANMTNCIIAGCDATVSYKFRPINDTVFMLIGNNFPNFSLARCRNQDFAGGNPGYTKEDSGRIIYNNKLLEADLSTRTVAVTLTAPVAIVQNQFEYITANTAFSNGTTAVKIFGNSDYTAGSVYLQYNTVVGGSLSMAACDTANTKTGTSGVQRDIYASYNVYDSVEILNDRYNSNIGEPGNSNVSYGACFYKNVNLFGSSARLATDLPHADSTDLPRVGDGMPINNIPNARSTKTQSQITQSFTSFTVAPVGTTLGGNYRPLNTSVLSQLIDASEQGLMYDISGTLRSAGCPGVLEMA